MSALSANDIDIVHAMQKASVLVVGDIMLDRFVYGKVERISPESPVPVLSVTRENIMLGGAGNTLANLINLQCKGRVLSIIGDDDEGRVLKDLAEKSNVDGDGLVAFKDRSTIVKTRFLAGHQQLLRTDFERVQPITDDIMQTLLKQAIAILPDVQAVILSDYGKGLLTPDFIKALITQAHELNLPVLVDPKGKDYSIYAGADVVTPNKKELSEATGGLPVDSDEEVVSAAKSLIASSGIKAVIATRSQDGMSVISGQDGEPVHIRSASDIEVFDVSGAGDTVIATIAASLAAGGSLVKAASIANVAGSIVVSKVGTAPIRSAELLEVLRHHDPEADIVRNGEANRPRIERVRQAPVLNWQEAREDVQRWKARGLNVGFTNGCFDILHYGHVTYLNDARQKCDRLIVGLNSDSSVRILKGAERPVHDEQSRARVLSALGSVDMVVLFGAQEQGDDNTACALLEQLQPDIYFKGGDYTVDQIPEAPTVIRGGGAVEVMPVYDGHSTTSSIKKMRA
tara:strand:+ start:4646 stop:6187 length:1542 start_codon:yes stop_codon:yes gene_type:complete